ncbi:pimeloyl-ACP methyl ester carboxylesterase [Sporosarcina luteola]|nr:pimeloyl-ACP methyl ester carboxylesterase [Sporosarcina luteola]
MKRKFWSALLVGVALLVMTGCSNEKESKEKDEGGDSMETMQGTWDGAIELPGQPLPITISIDKEAGTISIPAQGLHDYALSKVAVNGTKLTLEMNLQGQKLAFQGNWEKDEISGTFTQAGQQFPFNLVLRGPELGERIEVNVKGGKLSALLVEPQGDGPFPLMVIIAGSGPTDKDGNSGLMAGKNDSLKLVAQTLAKQGIASVRYDKRGIGDNRLLTTKEEDVRLDDFIEDASEFVKWAKQDSRFSKVGIIGHSEGSLIGMVAAKKVDADLFISVAGIGRQMDIVLKEQLGASMPDELKEQAFAIVDQLKTGQAVNEIPPGLEGLFRQSVQPYVMSMMSYDPIDQISQLSIPVLILNGDRDLQVGTVDAEALHKAKPDSELVIVEHMNHVLKDSPENREENLATYADPDLPLAEGLMEAIVAFIKEN